MNKQQRQQAIRERAERALSNLYHNATVNYPRIDDERESRAFESWWQHTPSAEIDYLAHGGAYGLNYRKTLSAECNAGRYKSERARAYYVQQGMRKYAEEHADCGMLTGWRVLEIAAGNKRLARIMRKHNATQRYNALWERIRDYGVLYTWGRGGRTLAPKDLVKQGGGSSFSIREDYAEEMSIAACVELIRVIESFNQYVAQWCDSVAEQWADQWREQQREERAEKRDAKIRAQVEQAFC